MGNDDVEKRAAAEQADADSAIARVHELEDHLRAELVRNKWDAVSADLLRYAKGGEMEDFPARLARIEAIKLLLMGLPNVVLQIEYERDRILHERDFALVAARRTKAGVLYKQKLAEFDSGYEKLSRAPDQTMFLTAADELSRLAWESGMMSDLRERFFWKWASRYRVDELARY